MAKKKIWSVQAPDNSQMNKKHISSKIINKKGSSLILVLVVIALITILSTLAMSLALNAYKASVQNKWADEDFYYCEECLDDVYGIIVAETNGIFMDNYKNVLTMFTKDNPEMINKAFREGIRLSLRSSETNTASALYTALNKTIEAKDENGEVIGELKVSYDSDRYNDNDLFVEEFKKGKYVFKDVCVEYWNCDRTMMEEDQKKFFGSVTTDIVIYIPDLVPSIEEDNEGSLNYVWVSNGDIALNGNVTALGNIYVGENFVINSSSKIELFSDYIAVCNQIRNNGEMSVVGASSSANIWCKDFILPEDGSSTLVAGNMFVNDDFEVNGDNCLIQLSGKYYGYGDGTTVTEFNKNHGGTGTGTNSAIVVNGKGTVFDMISINELVLSGHSFFPVAPFNTADQYQQVESLATIVSQSIYMVDKEYIDFTNRKVVIGNKSIDFSAIKIKMSDGTQLSLTDLLTGGYTLVTGGVNLEAVNITIDGTRVTETEFATNYLTSADQMVTLAYYTTTEGKYCSLYWNFKNGNELHANGADIVHESYITDIGKDGKIAIANNVAFDNIPVYIGGTPVNWGVGFLTVGDLYDNELTLVNEMEESLIFYAEYGEQLPASVNTATFYEKYLNSASPVKAIAVETEPREGDASYTKAYKLYLQWNFDSAKVANLDKGEAFISACLKAGLVDGYLEKFMDGGYIKISPDASVSSTTDLYEYIVDSDGYIAKKYGAAANSLFNSSVYAKNFSTGYKWYMTTLVPERYDVLSGVPVFDEKFNSGEKYSIFTRNSYYFNGSTNTNTEYLNFKTIDENSIIGAVPVSSSDGAFKNLMVNGNLTIDASGNWFVNNVPTENTIFEGIIFVDGDVTIDANIEFKGMIIAYGSMNINAGRYSYDADIVEGCLEVLKTDSNTIWWPLVSDEFYERKSDMETGSSSLNAVDCIKYENWTRNREKNN